MKEQMEQFDMFFDEPIDQVIEKFLSGKDVYVDYKQMLKCDSTNYRVDN
jgi:hypothetical protein